MSHFAVSVLIGKDELKDKTLEEVLQEKLAPYQENNMGDCPEEYLKFCVWGNDGETHWFEDEDEFEKSDIELKYPDEEGYWENPNAKWDWYVVGGRFSGFLLVDGKSVDKGRKKDIDWDGMKEQNTEMYKDNYERSFKDYPDNPDGREFFYGVLEGETLEEYLDRKSKFSTFAVITKDGEWREKGEMGWWGIADEKIDTKVWDYDFFDMFIKSLDEDDIIVIVDCHI